MKGQLHFPSANSTQAAARQAMAKLREKIERQDVRFIIDEPMHLRFRRPFFVRGSVLGVINRGDLQCTAEPAGYVIDYHLRIKPTLFILPLILISSTAIYAIVERDITFAFFTAAITGLFAWLLALAKRNLLAFLQSGVRSGYDADDDDDYTDIP